MQMVKEILLPINLKAMSTVTIQTVKMLQDAFQSNIELLHVIPDSPFYIENAELLEEAINLKLKHTQNALSFAGVSVSAIKILHGDVSEHIIDYAYQTGKNLIVVEKNNSREDSVDGVVDKLVSKALNPIWVVDQEEQQSVTVKKMLCAYDMSDNSERILKNAIVLSRAFSSELYLVHVIEQPYFDWWTKNEDYSQKQIEKAKRFLSQFNFKNVKTKEIFAHGKVTEQIRSQIDEYNPDLIFWGPHGRNQFHPLPTGGVSRNGSSRRRVSFVTMKEQDVFELPQRSFIESDLTTGELFNRAKELKNAGFLEEAVYYLKICLLSRDRKIEAYDEIAECYELLGHTENAEKYRTLSKKSKQQMWQMKVERDARLAKREKYRSV